MSFWRVPDQKADEVLEGCCAVPAMAEVPEGSGTHSKQSSGGFRYKNFPRSSKLLGVTHGFIYFFKYV